MDGVATRIEGAGPRDEAEQTEHPLQIWRHVRMVVGEMYIVEFNINDVLAFARIQGRPRLRFNANESLRSSHLRPEDFECRRQRQKRRIV